MQLEPWQHRSRLLLASLLWRHHPGRRPAARTQLDQLLATKGGKGRGRGLHWGMYQFSSAVPDDSGCGLTLRSYELRDDCNEAATLLAEALGGGAAAAAGVVAAAGGLGLSAASTAALTAGAEGRGDADGLRLLCAFLRAERLRPAWAAATKAYVVEVQRRIAALKGWRGAAGAAEGAASPEQDALRRAYDLAQDGEAAALLPSLNPPTSAEALVMSAWRAWRAWRGGTRLPHRRRRCRCRDRRLRRLRPRRQRRRGRRGGGGCRRGRLVPPRAPAAAAAAAAPAAAPPAPVAPPVAAPLVPSAGGGADESVPAADGPSRPSRLRSDLFPGEKKKRLKIGGGGGGGAAAAGAGGVPRGPGRPKGAKNKRPVSGLAAPSAHRAPCRY